MVDLKKTIFKDDFVMTLIMYFYSLQSTFTSIITVIFHNNLRQQKTVETERSKQQIANSKRVRIRVHVFCLPASCSIDIPLGFHS